MCCKVICNNSKQPPPAREWVIKVIFILIIASFYNTLELIPKIKRNSNDNNY